MRGEKLDVSELYSREGSTPVAHVSLGEILVRCTGESKAL